MREIQDKGYTERSFKFREVIHFPSVKTVKKFVAPGEKLTPLMDGLWKAIYLSSLVLAIFSCETAKLYFLFDLKSAGTEKSALLNGLIMSLSLVGVPAIGIFSDKSCRKKTLISLVFFGFIALFLLQYSQFIASVIQGLIGAAIVAVARAAYLDVRPVISELNPRKRTKLPSKDNPLLSGTAVVETIIIQASAWVLYPLFPEQSLGIVTKWLFGGSTILLLFFEDLRDLDKVVKHQEIRSAKREYLSGYAWQLLVAFFLYDCAFQTPNYFSDSFSTLQKFSREIKVIGSGILGGCVLTWISLLVISHSKGVLGSFLKKQRLLFWARRLIFFFSMLLLCVFLLPFIFYSSSAVSLEQILLFALVGGVILSLTFIYYTNKVSIHERGFLYGILEEIETLAEAVAPVLVLSLLSQKELTSTPFLILIGAGFLCLLRYKKEY